MAPAKRLRLRPWGIVALLALGIALGVGLVLAGSTGDEDVLKPDGGRWWVIEDHAALVHSPPERRRAVLREIELLGADTIRILARWHELTQRPRSARRPRFDASDPAQYSGFGPYDALVRAADEMGLRILITLAPDAPRWATEERRPVTPETVNLRPLAGEFGDFAAAVAKRYSGSFRGLPAVPYFSIWNEPNHELFLKPVADAPELYRRLVAAALPRLREHAAKGAQVLIGETAAVDRPDTVMGPGRFLRRLLCVDAGFRPVQGVTAEREGCTEFRGFDVDGFAHHPYGPAQRIPRKQDLINLLAIRRLGRYLDRAAAAGRLPERLPIYSTEFGLQSNPPDPTVSTTLDRQAQLLNEKEEFSYRYPRLRSYAQYLLYDDPARPGASEEEVWSGFQTGLRFNDGRAKPARDAYRLPIVVLRRGAGALIWGLVRPGSGARSVQLEREQGGRFVPSGARFATNGDGFFEVLRPRVGRYRFQAFSAVGPEAKAIGTSRVAAPSRERPLR